MFLALCWFSKLRLGFLITVSEKQRFKSSHKTQVRDLQCLPVWEYLQLQKTALFALQKRFNCVTERNGTVFKASGLSELRSTQLICSLHNKANDGVLSQSQSHQYWEGSEKMKYTNGVLGVLFCPSVLKDRLMITGFGLMIQTRRWKASLLTCHGTGSTSPLQRENEMSCCLRDLWKYISDCLWNWFL